MDLLFTLPAMTLPPGAHAFGPVPVGQLVRSLHITWDESQRASESVWAKVSLEWSGDGGQTWWAAGATEGSGGQIDKNTGEAMQDGFLHVGWEPAVAMTHMRGMIEVSGGNFVTSGKVEWE